MRPDRSGIPKRNGKSKILGGLKRIRQKSCSFEDDTPTRDTASPLCKSSNAEDQDFISLAATSELFEGLLEGALAEIDRENLSEEIEERAEGRLIRSQSYVVKEKGLIYPRVSVFTVRVITLQPALPNF